MSAARDDDNLDLPEVDDMVSTGAAADSADWDERLKGLPRLLRYAALVAAESDHIEKRLIAEIEEVCPQLPLNAAWAKAFDANLGVTLANELDHRAVVANEPDLRSLADCVRFLSLPTPRDSAYFEEHRRVGKALVQAFRKASRSLEQQLRSDLEALVFAWAALPTCTDIVTRNLRAASNVNVLAPLMFTYRIETTKAAIWGQIEKRDEQRRQQEEDEAKERAAEAEKVSSPPAEAASSRSLVVARLSEAQMKNPKLKEILVPLSGTINEALPLVDAPPLHEVRNELTFEFPYAANVIDAALSDLVGRATVHLKPLLIVGAPGGGKSRFARRLGEVLGVNVWRTDASQCDGAVFSGTSRRWSSAEPCHPLLAIAQGKIANPLVLIDELDKAASRSDYGRLWDAVLGFPEPETAVRYPDPALQTNLDLSQVSYIATANRLDPLPSPIRDRFRVMIFPIPTADDLDSLLPAVIDDLAKERGIDRAWLTPLDGMEHAAVTQFWRGGSVRRLRRLVDAVLRERDARSLKN